MYDSLIFDIDGTLWNACPAVAVGWNKALAEFDIERRITTEDIESVVGKPFEDCVAELLPELTHGHDAVLSAMEEQANASVKTAGGKLYQGVTAGMERLRQRYKLFIVSNCEIGYLEVFLQTSGIKPALSGFDCYGLSGKKKDEMLRNMKVEFSLTNPVYIGDTTWDEDAAAKAGIAFMHVTYGFGEAQKPIREFKSFTELTEYFYH